MAYTDPMAQRLTVLAKHLLAMAQRAGRPELVSRLDEVTRTLADTSVRVVVVGQFKQGKSALVNALVTAQICPIDDVVATSVPTLVRWGERTTAALITELSGDTEVIRTDIHPRDLRDHVTELSGQSAVFSNLYAEVTLPRKILANGLIFIDTPGVGRPQSHASTNLTLLPQADAVVMVSDATQEITQPELAFLSQAAELCPRITCVVSKSDLQYDWRSVVQANREHFAAAGIDAPLFVTSALMHDHAAVAKNRELLEEAGVTNLARHLHKEWRAVQAERHERAADEIRSVAGLLAMVVNAELEVLNTPQNGAAVVQDLVQAEERAERLGRISARWQQTLGDGAAELLDDIEFDLRDRLRSVGREAEELIESSDPGKSWDDIGAWLSESISQAVSDNFVWAHKRSQHLAEVVAQHFTLDGRASTPELSLVGTEKALRAIGDLDFVKSGSLTAGQKVMIGLKASYGGVLMFGLMTTLAGLALVNPVSIAAGLIMGGFAYKQDAGQRLEHRRIEAKAAVRRLIDEAIFQVSKESRDRLGGVKRLLRDHFISVAESFKLSLTESIRVAKRSAQLPQTERGQRLELMRRQAHEIQAVSEEAEAICGRASAAVQTAPTPEKISTSR